MGASIRRLCLVLTSNSENYPGVRDETEVYPWQTIEDIMLRMTGQDWAELSPTLLTNEGKLQEHKEAHSKRDVFGTENTMYVLSVDKIPLCLRLRSLGSQRRRTVSTQRS